LGERDGDSITAAVRVFKPWIVRRAHGGCQVLFPLSELDRIVRELVEALPGTKLTPPETRRGPGRWRERDDTG
jgi:hypothetical protein